jgi:cytochrome c biogenesis protein CcmG/thiol:disulfide interchange protein DsbE
MRTCILALLVFFGLTGELRADDPDPAAIMRAADQALSKAESISFRARVHGVGGKAVRIPRVEATVQAARTPKDTFGWKFLVSGEAEGAGSGSAKLLTAYDGKLVRSVRDASKQVHEAPASNADGVMADGAGWVMTWLVRWPDMVQRSFPADGATAACRYEGKMVVDGEPCHVIYVDYSELSDPSLFDAWWYIAEQDALPRRLDMHFIENAAGDGFTVLTLSDVRPGATIEPGQLAVATPEGFEVVKAQEPEKPEGGGRLVKSGVPIGEIAPDWTLKDTEGKEHTLSKYRGKIVIMDFWATWCPPCREAMPGIQQLHQKFKDKGVVVFGMNCWESADPAAYMKENGFSYTTLVQADPVAQAYQVSGIPTFYVVGTDGRVLFSFVGYDPNLEQRIEQIIEAATKP